MAAPRTRNWHAWIDTMPGAEPMLHVTGEVETNRGNLVPKLTVAQPQGINPQILILDLTIIEEGDFGTDDVAFRPVRFDMPAGKGQYTQVDVHFEGESIGLVDVQEVSKQEPQSPSSS